MSSSSTNQLFDTECAVEWPATKQCGGHGICIQGQCLCDVGWSSQSDFFNSNDCYEHMLTMRILYYGMLISHLIMLCVLFIRVYRWYIMQWKQHQRQKHHTIKQQFQREFESQGECEMERFSHPDSTTPTSPSHVNTIRVDLQPYPSPHHIDDVDNDESICTQQSICSTFACRMTLVTLIWCLCNLLTSSLHLFTSRRILYDPLITITCVGTNVFLFILSFLIMSHWANHSQAMVDHVYAEAYAKIGYDDDDADADNDIGHQPQPQALQDLHQTIIGVVTLLETVMAGIGIIASATVDANNHRLRRQLSSAMFMMTGLVGICLILFIITYCYETLSWLRADIETQTYTHIEAHTENAQRQEQEKLQPQMIMMSKRRKSTEHMIKQLQSQSQPHATATETETATATGYTINIQHAHASPRQNSTAHASAHVHAWTLEAITHEAQERAQSQAQAQAQAHDSSDTIHPFHDLSPSSTSSSSSKDFLPHASIPQPTTIPINSCHSDSDCDFDSGSPSSRDHHLAAAHAHAHARSTISRLSLMLRMIYFGSPFTLVSCFLVALLPFAQSKAGYLLPLAMMQCGIMNSITIALIDLNQPTSTNTNRNKNGTKTSTTISSTIINNRNHDTCTSTIVRIIPYTHMSSPSASTSPEPREPREPNPT